MFNSRVNLSTCAFTPNATQLELSHWFYTKFMPCRLANAGISEYKNKKKKYTKFNKQINQSTVMGSRNVHSYGCTKRPP